MKICLLGTELFDADRQTNVAKIIAFYAILWTRQKCHLMLWRKIIAVCSEIRKNQIHTSYVGKTKNFLMLTEVVRKVTINL